MEGRRRNRNGNLVSRFSGDSPQRTVGTVAIDSARRTADSEADKPPMPVPTTSGDFLALVRKSGVVDHDLLDPFERRLSTTGIGEARPQQLSTVMVKEGLLS